MTRPIPVGLITLTSTVKASAAEDDIQLGSTKVSLKDPVRITPAWNLGMTYPKNYRSRMHELPIPLDQTFAVMCNVSTYHNGYLSTRLHHSTSVRRVSASYGWIRSLSTGKPDST